MMTMDFHKAIAAQYNAALAMLKSAVAHCPDALWDDHRRGNAFWRTAYHALLYTHLYLEETLESHRPWEKHNDAYRFDGPAADADVVCPKSEVLAYVDFCRRQVAEKVPVLDLSAPSGFHWLPFSKFELQLYSLRHLQQHVGELMERLGPESGVDWVGSQLI